MASIPIIQDSAQLQTNTGRQRISVDASAFGAQEARAAGAVKQGLSQVASVAAEIDDDFNEANARELDNELSQRLRDRLYNPETGYFTTQRGRNAVDNRAAVEAEVDAIAAELLPRARNARASALFQNVARQRLVNTLGEISEYAARQNETYRNEVSEAALLEARDNIVSAYDDPVRVAAQRNTAIAEIESMAQRNGWDDSVRDQRIRQFVSDASSRVIVQLATSDPDAAEEYFRAVRDSLTAQDAAELQTSMRVAQRAALERVEGMAWQAFANGQSLQEGMGPEAYREFTTNPLYGQAHAQLQTAIRVRQQSYAAGGAGPRDNSAAYRALVLEENLNPERFIAPGALEAFVAEHADQLSTGDIERAFASRRALTEGGGSGGAAGQQSARFNAIRNVATAALRPYGVDLGDNESAETRAFEAALLRAVQEAPPEEDPQVTIGRAVVGMRSADVNDLPQFEVRGNRGRTNRSAVRPTTEAVVPYALIDPTTARALGSGLQRRIGRVPTQGEVENAYAAMLRRPENESVDAFYNRILNVGGGE